MAPLASPPHWEAPPPDYVNPMVEAYKPDMDGGMLRENLTLTVEQRFESLIGQWRCSR